MMTTNAQVRTSHSTAIKLRGSVDNVFPLFEPDAERKWVDGWDPTVVFPMDGTIGEGLVFTTEKDGETAIWTMIHYDAINYRVEYNKVEPGHVVIHVCVDCVATDDATTMATISYAITALSTSGETRVKEFTAEYYVAWIGNWQEAINHYLDTGTKLT
jgi:hypothetical protein